MISDLSLLNIVFILVIGTVAGFINAMAGGGSILTLPLLIFLGLPAGVANGTNRVAILVGCFSSSVGFHQNGIRQMRPLKWMLVPCLVGALVGANIALNISDEILNKVIAVLMVFVAAAIVFMPLKNIEEQLDFSALSTWKKSACAALFFIMGIYGGFIQAGVGFLMLLVLSSLGGMDLLHGNLIKNVIVLIYTVFVLAYFALNGKVDWLAGGLLAVGMAVGGWLGAHMAVKKGQKFVKVVVLICACMLSIKLLLK